MKRLILRQYSLGPFFISWFCAGAPKDMNSSHTEHLLLPKTSVTGWYWTMLIFTSYVKTACVYIGCSLLVEWTLSKSLAPLWKCVLYLQRICRQQAKGSAQVNLQTVQPPMPIGIYLGGKKSLGYLRSLLFFFFFFFLIKDYKLEPIYNLFRWHLASTVVHSPSSAGSSADQSWAEGKKIEININESRKGN